MSDCAADGARGQTSEWDERAASRPRHTRGPASHNTPDNVMSINPIKSSHHRGGPAPVEASDEVAVPPAAAVEAPVSPVLAAVVPVVPPAVVVVVFATVVVVVFATVVVVAGAVVVVVDSPWKVRFTAGAESPSSSPKFS